MQGLLAAVWLLLTLGLQQIQPQLQPPRPLTVYEAYQVTQDDEYDDLIVEAAQTWSLDPFLLKGLIYEESGGLPTARNPDSGATGLGQFVRAGITGLNNIRCLRLYHKFRCDLGDDEFTREKALDPEEATQATAELLAYHIGRWGLTVGVESYNGNKWKKAFAQRVLRRTNRFRTTAGLPPLRSHPRPRPAPFPSS